MDAGGTRDWRAALLGKSAAPLLILEIPFVVFLRYHGYGLGHLEVWLCFMALAGIALVLGAAAATSSVLEFVAIAGVLTLLADIQYHPPKGLFGLAAIFAGLLGLLSLLRQPAVRIVRVAAAAVLVSSLLVPARSHAARIDALRPVVPPPRGNGPLVLHLVLDEQIGIEGSPSELTPAAFSSELRSFFVTRGFHLFGRAYSEYFETYQSIGHLVNFRSGSYTRGLVAHGHDGFPWELRQNRYFARLRRQGYAIRVYQPDYLNFCAGAAPATSCVTYSATSPGILATMPLRALEKAPVVAGMYLDRSNTYAAIRHAYRVGRRRLATLGVHLPAWSWEHNRLSPIASMRVLDALARDISTARRGQVLFAHILLPHHPYVYGASCRPRPPSEWLERLDNDNLTTGEVNTAAGRAVRYARYMEQVRCLEHELQRLLDGIPEPLQRDAIVILQGDHGSRIARVEPRRAGAHLTPADFRDNYSTLFAVRAPQIAPGYDSRIAPITCLLSAAAATGFQLLASVDACAASPTVFLEDGDRMLPVRFGGFSATTPDHQ